MASSVCPADRTMIAQHDLKEFASMKLTEKTEKLNEKVESVSASFLKDRVDERNRDEVGRVRALVRALGAKLPQYWLTTYAERPKEASGIHSGVSKEESGLQEVLARTGYQSMPTDITHLGPTEAQLQAITAEAKVSSVLMARNPASVWSLSLASGMMTNGPDSPLMADRKRENPGLPSELEESYYSELITHFTLTNSGSQGSIRRKMTVVDALVDSKSAGFAIFHKEPLGAALDPSGHGVATTSPMLDPALNAGGAYIINLIVK
eukprot:1992295-Amphidinium_carterae.2